MVNEIRLVNLIPEIFANRPETAPSDIWLTDITLSKGRRYLIEAASGTGKTSLCSFVMGMRTDYRGQIIINGVESRSFSRQKWTRLRRFALGWLPQELGLFPDLSLKQNLEIKNDLTSSYSLSTAKELAERLEIADKWDVKTRLLSIGQQQRAAFIRMLCQPADFFLLDEPVSHLDSRNKQIMAEILTERVNRDGAGLIITSVGNRIGIDHLTTLKL